MRHLQIQVPDLTLGLAARMTNRQTFFTIAPDTLDERQPENGENQVNPHQRDGPPHDNYCTRRETKILGLDSDAIYLYLLGTFNSNVSTTRHYTSGGYYGTRNDDHCEADSSD